MGRVGLAALLSLVTLSAYADDGARPSAARQEQLRVMVAQDCGSCHGMTLKGGLGSPLLPEVMAAVDAEGLVETILEGRPGTPMPPWKTLLSRQDARWIAAYLQGEIQ